MPTLAVVTVVGLIVAAVLVAVYLNLRRKDQIAAFMEKRRGSARLVSRAEYVEGVEKMPVALSLTADNLYYENPDLEASFELNRLDEIEYAEDLSTGRQIEPHWQVLRLRSHGTTFEFLLDKPDAQKWIAALPPRLQGGQPAARAV